MQRLYTQDINASALKTFSCLTNPEKMRQVLDGQAIPQLKTLQDFDSPVGTKFHQNIAGLVEFDGEIIAFQPPTDFGIGVEVMGIRGTIFYNLKEIDDAHTRLNFNLELFDGSTVTKILISTLMPLFESTIQKYLDSIKNLAEQPEKVPSKLA
jgi:hypothetical protein